MESNFILGLAAVKEGKVKILSSHTPGMVNKYLNFLLNTACQAHPMPKVCATNAPPYYLVSKIKKRHQYN